MHTYPPAHFHSKKNARRQIEDLNKEKPVRNMIPKGLSPM